MKIADMGVELLDYMGDDLSVVNAARVSFSKMHDTFQDNDKGLIKYLASHNHWTPFGHVFFSFRIKAPIFVARQLAKHQVGLVWNEVSRRYVDKDVEFFVPETLRARAENVKQGSSEKAVGANGWLMAVLKNSTDEARKTYEVLLGYGVCPEMARMVLPQSMMTEWWWSGSLAAFTRVYKLRTDSHAQAETQWIAREIGMKIADVVPVSWEALTGHAWRSHSFDENTKDQGTV